LGLKLKIFRSKKIGGTYGKTRTQFGQGAHNKGRQNGRHKDKRRRRGMVHNARRRAGERRTALRSRGKGSRRGAGRARGMPRAALCDRGRAGRAIPPGGPCVPLRIYWGHRGCKAPCRHQSDGRGMAGCIRAEPAAAVPLPAQTADNEFLRGQAIQGISGQRERGRPRMYRLKGC